MKDDLYPSVETEMEFKEEPIREVTIGFVVGAKKLRVRRQANKEAEIICLLNEGDEVKIIREKSTHKFYRVVLTSGIEGFCLKEFIKLK